MATSRPVAAIPYICRPQKDVHEISQAYLDQFRLHIDGQFRLVDEYGDPFEWHYHHNRDINIYRYVRVTMAIDWYVEECLTELLVKVWLQKDKRGAAIFVSRNFEHSEHLLVLIDGGGVCRAGMWSRSQMISENVDSYSQFPYIREALSKDWAVLVTNPHDTREVDGSRNRADHGLHVWKFLSTSKHKKIAIVAHGVGGQVVLEMLNKNLSDFTKRVFAIALIFSRGRPAPECKSYFDSVTANWVQSREPLGTPQERTGTCIYYCLSSGTIMEKLAPPIVMDQVFRFISDSFTKEQPGSAVQLAKRRREREIHCQLRRERLMRQM